MSEQRYRVVKRLDSGGMAEVFVGMATSIKGFDKVVAIKRVLPNLTRNRKFVRMFLDEARLSLQLSHTNVVQVFDVGQADGTYFIVMEYIDGVNLKTLLETTEQRGGHLGIPQSVLIASEVCKGLSYAHDLKDPTGQPLGIVHRDISPPNVLISEQGEVKIADFGLAKARSQVEHTDPGFVKGKFGYLSPEAAYGEAIDLRTDIFAVGIVLWEMLAGRRLFQGPTDLKTLDLVRKARIPELTLFNADVPPDLESIVYKALARDKGARYQRCDELGNDLMHFLFDHGLKVSSFDVADLVKQAKSGKISPAARPMHEGIDEMIQQEISHFISDTALEQMSQATLGANALEDPAQWFDFAEDPMAAPSAAGSTGRSRFITIQAIGPAASPQTSSSAANAAADDDAAPPDLDLSDGPAPMFRDDDAAGAPVDVDFDGSEQPSPSPADPLADSADAPATDVHAAVAAHPDDRDDTVYFDDVNPGGVATVVLPASQLKGEPGAQSKTARKIQHQDAAEAAGWEGESTRIINPSEQQAKQQQTPPQKSSAALLGAAVAALIVIIIIVVVVAL